MCPSVKTMCTKPNYLIWNGKRDSDDKEVYTFQPHTNYDKILKSGCVFVEIPCGSCLECRQQHVSQWADRCVFHSKQFKHNVFLTLTYDDNHVPVDGSLVKSEISDFIRKLRDYFKYHKLNNGNKISYFGCGEYGGETARPHYHVIIFNCELPDLSDVFLREENGRLIKSIRPNDNNHLKFSKIIYDLWEHKGMISVGEVNYSSCAYVAGYCEKKTDLKRTKRIKALGLVPEFVCMSKGIGKSIFNVDMFGKPLIVPNSGKAKVSQIPRYYEKLLQKFDFDLFEDLKHNQACKRLTRINTYLNSDRLKDVDNSARESILQNMYKRSL